MEEEGEEIFLSLSRPFSCTMKVDVVFFDAPESRGVALWRSFARGKWHRNEIECYRLVNRQD